MSFHDLAESFRQIKAENDRVLKDHFKEVFVRTEAVELLEQHGPYIFIGRKGSGKTALIEHFRETNAKQYNTIINIVADQEHSWLLYRFYHKKFVALHGETKKLADIKDVFDLQTLFTTAWAAAIQVAIMDRFLKNSDLTEAFPEYREHVSKFLKAKFAIDYELPETNVADRVHGLLPNIFEAIQVSIEVILATHGLSIGVVLSRLTSWLTRSIDTRLVEDKANNAIKDLLEKGHISALVTLDKYDDYVDNLVKTLDDKRMLSEQISENIDDNSHERERSAMLHFQRHMLSGLLLATKDLRETTGYDKIHYAFAVPQDRFAELRLRETAVFDVSHIDKIKWTPLHLLELFVRRCLFAYGENASFESTEDILQQYKKILRRLNLPETVQNSCVPDAKEDFFLYLIRHSMWRPRDIQRYLYDLFDGCAKMAGTNIQDMENRIRGVVSDCSQRIINDEFLIEYQVEYPKLAEIIDRFRNRPNVFDDEYLRNRILGSKLLSLSYSRMSTDGIIERLFGVGFLGIRKTRNLNRQTCIKQREQYIDYRFYYNEQIVNARFSGPKLGEGEQWVIHPMFYDRLDSQVLSLYVVHQLEWTPLLNQYTFFHHLNS